MRDDHIGRTLRALRYRRGWRQSDLAVRGGVSRSVISDLEAGKLGHHTLDALRTAIATCGGSVRVEIRVPGGDTSRLLDADHARLQAAWAGRLRRRGWLVDTEVTFNHFGERGSIDILAWHPAQRLLLVGEVKTVIVDVQQLLAGIDRKVRIGAGLARHGARRPVAVVPALLVLEGTTARRRVVEHAPLFARFSLVGRAALAWIRSPTTVRPAPTGVLCFTKQPHARSGDLRRAGRQRIRLPSAPPRSGSDAHGR